MIHCPSCHSEMVTMRPVEIRLSAEPNAVLVTAAVACTSCPAISEVVPQNNYRAVEYPGLTVGHMVAMHSPLMAINMTVRTLRPSPMLSHGES